MKTMMMTMGPRVCSGVTLAAMTLAGAALAGESSFKPYVSAQYLHESNVYKFSSQVAGVTGTRDTSDRIQRYTAGLETSYTWSQQKLHALVEGRRINYADFNHLDHNERAFEAGFDGGILSNTRGLLNFRDERRMASFEDRRSTQLTMERDLTGRGALDINITPQWHFLTGVRGRHLRSPLPDAPALPLPPPGAPARLASPDFALRESAYHVGVQFGIEDKENPTTEAPLLFGFMMERATIRFSNATPQPVPPPPMVQETFEDYELLSLQATAQYAATGLSIFDAKLGTTYYKAMSSGASSEPDMTGEIGYTRQLSVVTEINAHLFRRIVPYAATSDAAIDTGVSVGAKWQPGDLTALVNYSYAESAFRGSSGSAPEDSGRNDKTQNATLSFAYPLFQYFGVRLFGSYSARRSSLGYNDYTDQTAGVELTFRWL